MSCLSRGIDSSLIACVTGSSHRRSADQVFLVLSWVGKAEALVTGDADVLAMRDDFPGLILTAEELAESSRTEK
jgi:predicted nucleic acid-binding protein